MPRLGRSSRTRHLEAQLRFACEPVSAMQIQEAAIEGVIRAGDEARFIRTEEQRERCDFHGLCHSTDRLAASKILEHFLFASWVIPVDEVIDEGRVNASGRN